MSVSSAGAAVPAGLLDRERIVAGPRFNRWLVPPAALAIHLCIGMAYGFSVFWLPLSRAVGVAQPKACPGHELLRRPVVARAATGRSHVGWIFTLFSSCSAPRRPSGATGWRRRARARPVWSPRSAGAAAC